MAAAYPWIKNSGDISGAPTGRLAITSTSGIYLSTSANSSILGPPNADISIQSDGTGDIILKTNNNNRLTINDTGDVTSSKNLIINNSSIGGPINPTLSLNLTNTSGTTVTQEIYNQKTATSGSVYDCFFFAKDSAGTKVQYAGINVSTPQVISSASRGSMLFSLKDTFGGNVPYITLDGLNTRVQIPKQIYLQNNMLMTGGSILNCNIITTNNGNYYTPQSVKYLIDDNEIINGTDDRMRQILVNVSTGGGATGWSPSSTQSINPLPNGGNPTTSAFFNTAWWVGTDNGSLYYSYDNGNSWSLQLQVSGRINVLFPFRGGSYLAIGGDFVYNSANTFYHVFVIDTGNSEYDITNGDKGLNNPVYGFSEDFTGYSMLYVVGSFTATSNNSSFSNFWWNWDANSQIGYSWDNANTPGFQGNVIYSIAYDSNSGSYVVGGEFYDLITNSGSTGYTNLVSVNFANGIDINSAFSFGFFPNGLVYKCVPYNGSQGQGVLIGGNFNNSAGLSNCNTNYGIYGWWNGSLWDFYDYPNVVPNAFINNIWVINSVVYTCEQDIKLYQDYTLLPSIPSGSKWTDVNDNGLNVIAYATDAQPTDPYWVLSSSTGSVTLYLNTNSQQVNYLGNTYVNSIELISAGANCELIYNIGDNTWYVLSTMGTINFN